MVWGGSVAVMKPQNAQQREDNVDWHVGEFTLIYTRFLTPPLSPEGEQREQVPAGGGVDADSAIARYHRPFIARDIHHQNLLILREAVAVMGGEVGNSNGKTVSFHRKKVVRRMIISPSIMHLATKVRGVMEATDQELHDGASKFTLELNIH